MATNESLRADLERPATPAHAVAPRQIRDTLEAMRPEFARILGDAIGTDRFVRVALTEIRSNPSLAACSEASVLGALMTCAQLNLTPGRAQGEAWLVPFNGECQFILGYKGMLRLAWQSGRLVSFTAQAVRENDEFDFAFGLDPYLRHKPTIGHGQAYTWYAAARLTGGGSAFEVMFREDVERHRLRSRSRDNGPWKTDYDAMARKTVIRQLAKFLPMSAEFSTALAHDGGVRRDSSPDALYDASEFPEVEA
jgi:recombination protein RecT